MGGARKPFGAEPAPLTQDREVREGGAGRAAGLGPPRARGAGARAGPRGAGARGARRAPAGSGWRGVTAAGECAPRPPREERIARPLLPVRGQASGEKPEQPLFRR